LSSSCPTRGRSWSSILRTSPRSGGCR
jgi:hypothetical protein